VVVAAVFSYVMLGAGFFTSQKSKEVVHTGVDQATSSVTTAGDIIGGTNQTTPSILEYIDVPLALTAGNNPVDVTKMVVSYTSKDDYLGNAWGDGVAGNYNAAGTYGTWNAAKYNYFWVQEITTNNMLEQNEKVVLHLGLIGSIVGGADRNSPGVGVAVGHGANYPITIEVKPSTGATLSISMSTPPVIKKVMTLI